jgi:hypothetical protein
MTTAGRVTIDAFGLSRHGFHYPGYSKPLCANPNPEDVIGPSPEKRDSRNLAPNHSGVIGNIPATGFLGIGRPEAPRAGPRIASECATILELSDFVLNYDVREDLAASSSSSRKGARASALIRVRSEAIRPNFRLSA